MTTWYPKKFQAKVKRRKGEYIFSKTFYDMKKPYTLYGLKKRKKK